MCACVRAGGRAGGSERALVPILTARLVRHELLELDDRVGHNLALADHLRVGRWRRCSWLEQRSNVSLWLQQQPTLGLIGQADARRRRVVEDAARRRCRLALAVDAGCTRRRTHGPPSPDVWLTPPACRQQQELPQE